VLNAKQVGPGLLGCYIMSSVTSEIPEGSHFYQQHSENLRSLISVTCR